MQQKQTLLKRLVYLCIAMLVSYSSYANDIWTNVTGKAIVTANERYIIPAAYMTYAIDLEEMSKHLKGAPQEFTVAVSKSNTVLELPMPNGEMQRFAIVESSLMPEVLSAKFPKIKSYLGQGIDDKTATVRLSIDPNGFHAMIISASGTVYVDPYSLNNTEHCITYYKEDFYATNTKYREGKCEITEAIAAPKSAQMPSGQSGDVLRVYRAAIAATGEYTNFHGGTTADAIAAINTTLNRINEVFEREASFRLILVDNNDDLIYTDSTTDPYTNGNTNAMIGENQTNVDAVVGGANYDIGHVFGKDSGGLAGLGVVCSNGQKARGVTGHSSPVGDPFDIDYVCHEMGHQYGATHSFNSDQGNCATREEDTAYEPGSGSTIMSYAGICGVHDIQSYADDYYQSGSFDQITAHTNGGGNCSENTATGNNIPVANAGQGGFTIPVNTPFELIGSGNDIDAGNELTYCWEEFDLGPANGAADNNLTAPEGSAPIFRSWLPTLSPTRVFPRMEDILAGTSTMGELLPTYSRDLTFRLTVRDNNAGGGGVSYDQMAFEASDVAGPFVVNNITEDWEYGNTYTVNWDVANTDVAPVNCATVDVYLSTDGGNTFDELLMAGVPNTGSTDIICPNIVSAQSRIKIKAVDNVFFNISNQFEIIEPTVPNFVVTVDPVDLDICSGEMAIFDVQIDPILNFNEQVNLSIADVPEGILVNFDPEDVTPGDNSTLTISSVVPIPAGNYPFQITASSATITHLEDVTINVYQGVPVEPTLNYPTADLTEVSLTPSFTWEAQAEASAYTLQIATDAEFTNIIHEFTDIDEATYPMDVMLDPETQYYWSVIAQSPCGDSESSEILSFTTGEENVTEIPGCTDDTMFNYDATATIDDGSCVPFVLGCTNPEADNFNPEANQENGSCIISGCTNEEATNYNPDANLENGSCIIEGCTDPLAANYNPEANLEDGSCVSNVIGCMDPAAYNYNPNANVESGTCDYTSWVIIDYNQTDGSVFNFWTYINNINMVNYLNWDMGDGTVYTAVDEPTHYYTENGTYEVGVSVHSTTGIYTAYATVVVTDVLAGCMEPEALNYDEMATVDDGSCIEVVLGCTDVNALNYDETANTDDGSCVGVVYGCTDATAINYNPEANSDDGSCEQEVLGCTDVEALNYNAAANTDDGSCEYPLPTAPSWEVEATSTNHIILIPTTANITINDMAIELGDYLGVFYTGQDGELHCAGMMMWTGITNTMTVYGSEPSEFNGMQVGEEFTWMTWKASINEVRVALADYDATMPNLDTYVVDGISAITALSNTMSQNIEFTEGWNLISTYIIPDYPGIGDVFAPIVEDLFLAKDELGHVYWPAYNLNNIGDHIMGKAYKVKMNADVVLEVRGAVANPLDYPLSLNEGWSYLGYLRKDAADITAVLESIEEDVLLVKDGVGNVYWPEFGVNTIGNMQPGQGYQIRMTNARVFTYPSNELALPELRLAAGLELNHFVKPEVQEMSMNIAIPNLLMQGFEQGDELAVKNQAGELIASEVYEGTSLALTLWMNEADVNTNFEVYRWSATKQKEVKVELTFDETVVLEENAVHVAQALHVLDTPESLFEVYPNPMSSEAQINFTQAEESEVKISLYNALGEEVLVILNETLTKGYQSHTIKVNELVDGIYFVKYQSHTESKVQLLQIQK